jgi:soluble lytic murein transglycosylase-like protein
MTSAYLAALFLSATQAHHLPVGLLSAVCWVESNHDIQAIHFDDGPGDSIGICQLQLASARMVGFKGSATRLQAPAVNIYWAGAILAAQHSRYHRDILRAIGAYNAGSYLTRDGRPVNQAYIKAVLRAWKENR